MAHPASAASRFFPTLVANRLEIHSLDWHSTDLRHALRFDEDCPFFCYRAVDQSSTALSRRPLEATS